jgi:hypothetical protein
MSKSSLLSLLRSTVVERWMMPRAGRWRDNARLLNLCTGDWVHSPQAAKARILVSVKSIVPTKSLKECWIKSVEVPAPEHLLLDGRLDMRILEVPSGACHCFRFIGIFELKPTPAQPRCKTLGVALTAQSQQRNRICGMRHSGTAVQRGLFVPGRAADNGLTFPCSFPLVSMPSLTILCNGRDDSGMCADARVLQSFE